MQFKFNIFTGKRKLQTRRSPFGQGFPEHQRNPTFADIGAGRIQSFSFEYDFHQHLHRLPEVTAALFYHGIQRRMKTAQRIQGADRFLQNEVGAHIERFLGRRSLPVENGERNRVLVARGALQRLQDRQSSAQIVAIHNYRIELVGDQHVGASSSLMADFHVNR